MRGERCSEATLGASPLVTDGLNRLGEVRFDGAPPARGAHLFLSARTGFPLRDRPIANFRPITAKSVAIGAVNRDIPLKRRTRPAIRLPVRVLWHRLRL